MRPSGRPCITWVQLKTTPDLPPTYCETWQLAVHCISSGHLYSDQLIEEDDGKKYCKFSNYITTCKTRLRAKTQHRGNWADCEDGSSELVRRRVSLNSRATEANSSAGSQTHSVLLVWSAFSPHYFAKNNTTENIPR